MPIKNTKTLFLLTKTYPYGNGEQYITNELTYLSKEFEKIIIYPNDYYGNEGRHSKILPNNVEVLNFNLQLPKKSNNSLFDYWYLLKNTFLEFIETEDKRNFFKNFKWNLINFWTQLQISKSFADYLKKNNFNSTNSVFYSYWFHKSVIFLSILKSKKQIEKFCSRAHSIDLYHNYWGLLSESSLVPSFKIFKLKHTGKIFCISKHGADFLKTHYPKYRNRIETSLLGVNAVNDTNKSKRIHPFLIVTCSHLDSCKRLDLLAESLSKIKHPVKWVHFGGGFKEEEEKIKDHLKEKETFIDVELKGYVSNEEVHQFYQFNEVNLFVNLSIVEGIPVSIMEAMAYEIPILATAIYGVPEAVLGDKNGFLLDVNFSIPELTQKLNFCMENKDLLKKMGENSKEIYLEKFNAEKNYTAFAHCLSNL